MLDYASSVSELWLPGVAGPQDDFVQRLHRQIERFAADHGLEQPIVEVRLRDGTSYALGSISADPGYGFITIRPHAEDTPDEVIVPVGALARIDLCDVRGEDPRPGFSLPEASAG